MIENTVVFKDMESDLMLAVVFIFRLELYNSSYRQKTCLEDTISFIGGRSAP